MRSIVLHSIILFCSLCLAATVNASPLVIPGTGDGVAVLRAVADSFKESTGVSVEIPESVGSSGGIVMAGNGQAEIARVARNIKEKEAHFKLTFKPIFKVPTVFFLSENVAIDNLSQEQVLSIFSGKITNWNELGGPDEEIKVFVRESGDSSYNNLKETFSGFKDVSFAEKAITALKTNQMVTFLKYEKNAIGFGPLDVALSNGLKYSKIDDISPLDSNYPFFGTIGLVYKPEGLSTEAKDFLEYISSSNAATAIAKFGGIPVQ